MFAVSAVPVPLSSDQQPIELKLTLGLSSRLTGDTHINTPARQTSGPAVIGRRPAGTLPSETLLLDVSVNSQRLSGVVQAEEFPGGSLLMAADAWKEARLALPAEVSLLSDGAPAYALDAIKGMTYSVNRQSLSLEINAPASAFIGSTLKLQQELGSSLPRPPPGLLLNYDVSLATAGQGGPMVSGALLEVVAFGRLGNFVNAGLVRDDSGKRSVERLDTFWRYDMPERLETMVVGDTVGVGGGWSRPARYGGVRWGRDFGQRPGYVTFPQLTLNGEAALPSTVDILVNNARRGSQQVPPGPFELTNVPLITGAGEVNLVVRDLLGRETLVRQSYYAAQQLLAYGLTDFSFEAGRLRTGYGQGSQYGSPFGAATWRQGLSGKLTGEARLEVQADRRATGMELTGLIGTWGVGRVALAASQGSTQGVAEKGQLLQMGVERSTPTSGGALQYQRTSQGFAPFGEATGPLVASQRARERWLAAAGGALWGDMSGGFNYVSQTRWDGDNLTTAGISLNMPLWQRASLSVSLNKRLDGDRSWLAGINVNMTLDGGTQIAARTDTASGTRSTGSISASRNPAAGLGLGWRTEVSSIESQRARAGLQYNTNFAELALDVASDAQGKVATRAGARGSLGMMADLPFASRSIGQGSFAVVEVPGIAGVPIKRSHQVVAETDRRGLAFLPGLLPWQKNQLEIDPTDLPLDVEIGDVVQYVTPYAGSGAFVKFAVRRTRQALLVLHQPDGQPVPVGTKVQLLPAERTFWAGRRGEVWLTDLDTEQQRLRVSWLEGSCVLNFQLPVTVTDGNSTAKIGPLACGKQ